MCPGHDGIALWVRILCVGYVVSSPIALGGLVAQAMGYPTGEKLDLVGRYELGPRSRWLFRGWDHGVNGRINRLCRRGSGAFLHRAPSDHSGLSDEGNAGMLRGTGGLVGRRCRCRLARGWVLGRISGREIGNAHPDGAAWFDLHAIGLANGQAVGSVGPAPGITEKISPGRITARERMRPIYSGRNTSMLR